MTAPEIFVKFCEIFHQDINLVYSSLELLLSDFFASHSTNEIDQLQEYLAQRLAEADVQSLEEEWFNSGAEIDFPDNQIEEFYRNVVEFEE